MKKVLSILIYCLLSHQFARAETVTWTGDGDGKTWEDPLNWDTMKKPTGMQDVVILADSVSMSSIQSVNSLKIENGALNISGLALFQTNGSKNTSPFYALSLYNSSIYISGKYYIVNSQSIMFIDELSKLIIEPHGQLDINSGTGQFGIVNSGLIHIKSNGTLIIKNKQCNRGINNLANVINEGEIDIQGSGIDEHIFNYINANFDNYGVIYLRDAGNKAIYNFAKNSATFNNFSTGTINVDMLIDSSGNFANSGTILCKGQDADQLNIAGDDSYFENFGLLKFCLTSSRSIAVFNNSSFINEIGAQIEADLSCPSTIGSGTFIGAFAPFENYGNIILDLNHKTSGLVINSSFINNGLLTVTDAYLSSVYIGGLGYFDNTSSGQISIEGELNKDFNTFYPAFFIDGQLINNGKISVSSSDTISWKQESQSSILNNGIIDLKNGGTSVRLNGGELLNRNCGLITLDRPVVNASGIFSNEGIIYDKNHNIEFFDASNSGLIYEDLTGHASEGMKNHFPMRSRGYYINMPDSLFATETLSLGSSIASFEQHSNSFPPVYFWRPKPDVNLMDTYYFKVESVSGCNRILALKRNIIPQCGSYKTVTAYSSSNDFFDRSNWEQQLIPGVCENVIINHPMKLESGYKAQFNNIEFETGSLVEIEAGAVLETLGQ